MFNVTLLVQMANFGVAYLLFTRIFFKRAVIFLQTEDHKLLEEQRHIDVQAANIAVKIAHNEQGWSLMQKNLQTLRPPTDYQFSKATFEPSLESSTIQVLSEHDVVVLVKETQQAIVDRLEHA